MSDNTPLADGIIFKKPHENAPPYCVGKLSVKIPDFIEFMQTHNNNDWINLEIMISKAGKPYIKLDTWKPQQQNNQQVYSQPQQGYSQPPPPPKQNPPPFPDNQGDQLDGLGGGTEDTRFEKF